MSTASSYIPVFKALAEMPVTMTAGDQMTDKNDGYMYFEVPAAKPNVIVEPKVSETGFHSATVELQFSEQTIEDLLKGSYEDQNIYFALYEGSADNLGVVTGNKLTNNDNRYFTCRNDKDLGGEFQGIEPYDNYVFEAGGSSGNEDGFIIVKNNEDGNPKTTYRIAIRNLEIGETYTLKMYCKTKEGEVEVIDVSGKINASEDEDTEEKKAYAIIRTQKSLSISQGAISYERLGYNNAGLDYAYSISAGASTDYYLEYKIVRKNGDGTYETVLDWDRLLELLGYTRGERFAMYYTGATWEERKYYVYFSKDDTGSLNPISPALANELHFEGWDLDRELGVRTYYIEMHAYDLHHGSDDLHQGKDEVPYTGGDNPRREFTVPARKSEQTKVSVTYDISADGETGSMNLTLPVSDPDFRLGEDKDGNRGDYKVTISKWDGEKWVPCEKYNPTILNTLRSPLVQITPVIKDEQYRVEIKAHDIDLGTTKVLYDSEKYPLLQEKLKVPDFNAVMLGNVVSAFSGGKVTLRSSGGQNLDKIKTIDISVTNLTTYVFGSSAATPNGFQSGRMEINVSSILNGWASGDLNKGDLINVSVDFKDEDGQSVEQWSGTFEY